MIEFKIIYQKENNYVADIFEDKVYAGGIEFVLEDNFYIEMIKKDEKYKRSKLLKRVINYISQTYNCDITCLPLAQYRPYYEELGFKIFQKISDDDIIYYLPKIKS